MTKKVRLTLIFLLIIAVVGGATGVTLMKFMPKKARYTYSATEEVFKNPLMGFAPSADSKRSVADNSLVYVDVTFRELEPEEGVYAFEEIEASNYLDRWREEGKHVVFRFVCDKPGDEPHRDIPDWLYEKIEGDGKNYDTSYGKGFSPNYENPIFMEAHAKAVLALGEHFGQDTFFSYVELGSLGHWGEWHVMYEAGIPRIPSEEVRRNYITPYLTAFPHAKIMMRRPFRAAEEYGFGLFDDMAGHPESTEEWLDWIENGGDYSQAQEEDALVPMPDAWKTAPIGGEFNSDLTMEYMLRYHIDETVDLIRRSHTTFLGPKSPTGSSEGSGSDCVEGIEAVLKTMGYRFSIARADITNSTWKEELTVSLSWENNGIAPIYWDWTPYLYIVDENGQAISKTPVDIALSELCPGDSMKTKTRISTADLPEGAHTLCIGIEDPLSGEPSVYFTMDAERIGTLSVLCTF